MDQHPFHMETSILSQPAELQKVTERNIESILETGSGISARDGGVIYLVGTGSSLHSAELASWLFRSAPGNRSRVIARPCSSYEFVTYTPPLRKEDVVIVISHRGYKSYSNRSLGIAKRAGCLLVAVTGFDSTIGADDADAVFRTVKQEESSAHTVSLTTSLGILLSLSIAVSEAEKDARREIESTVRKIAGEMETVLKSRGRIKTILNEFDVPERIWISGSGPNKTVAHEAALKVQETSYTDAYGFEIEQLIHGPMRASDIEKDLFIPIIWGSNGSRSRELVKAISAAGGHVVTVSDSIEDLNNCLPSKSDLEEYLSPFVTLVPLQLISLYLAERKGTNPDSFRKDERHFSKIDSMLKL